MSASEVTTRDVPPRIRSLPTLPVDVLAIPGIFLWGPINQAQTVIDFDDFLKKYRGFQLNWESAVQIRQAFLGGTRKVIANRIVHVNPTTGVPVTAAKATSTAQTAATAATTATVTGTVVGPFVLAPGDTLIGNVESGGNQTATFSATAGLLENTPAETYALADAQTLLVAVDGGSPQTIIFNTAEFAAIGAATAEEVAAVINAEITGASALATSGGTKVTITSDRRGTGSSIEVTGGTSNGVLIFAAGVNSGTGNVSDIDAVTVAEVKTIVEAAWTNGSGVLVTNNAGAVQIDTVLTGASATLIVDATSTADDELGLDNATHTGGSGLAADTLKIDGKYEGGTIGNTLTYDIAAATSGVAAEFDVVVFLGGTEEETHRNLTMDATSAFFADTVVARDSDLIATTDQGIVGTATQKRPANVTGAALSGGDDGLTALDDNDFVGIAGPQTGLQAFNVVNEGDVLIAPDRPTTTLGNAASLYCNVEKKNTMIFLPDIPAGLDDDGVISHADSLTRRETSTGVAWPRIKIPNPDKTVFGTADTIVVASSGSVAGKMARNTILFDTNVFTQPGNEIFGRLENVVDVETDQVNDIKVRRKVTSARVNPIVAMKDTTGAFGVWLNDVQALKGDGNFTSIGEIHGMSLIRKVIMAYLETIRTTPNTTDNRRGDQKVVKAYLLTWLARGVFASNNADEAFYVNTDPDGVGINNPIEQEAERYHMLVAVATAKSRRLVEVLFTRDQRAVENFIQQQLNSP